jgi:M6 family metalloprotease-like protein
MCAIEQARGRGQLHEESHCGRDHVLWIDAGRRRGTERLRGHPDRSVGRPAAVGNRPRLILYLTEDNGDLHLLEVDDDIARSTNWMALNGRGVRVSGRAAPLEQALSPDATQRLQAVSVSPLDLQVQPRAQSAVLPTVTRNQAFATVLCRSVDFPLVPHESTWYRTLMEYPGFGGMDHYFRENSYGAVSLLGSEVFGWFDLGKPRSAYWLAGDSTRYNHPLMAQDCATAADASVDFSRFAGVNLQFSFPAPASWGGLSLITADGRRVLYRTTWLASWAGRHVYAHEIGHTFGLPHSSGPYELTYDSKWDVMSAHAFYDHGLADWVGHHTIGAHKRELGWLAQARMHTPLAGTISTLDVGAIATGQSHAHTLLIEVPLVEFFRSKLTVTRRSLSSDSQANSWQHRRCRIKRVQGSNRSHFERRELGRDRPGRGSVAEHRAACTLVLAQACVPHSAAGLAQNGRAPRSAEGSGTDDVG